MSRVHEEVVEAQFGPRAKAYVESAVHASGEDLDALRAIVGAARPARAIDLGSGGGHVSYLLAEQAGSVTAVDLSSEMLAAVAATAKQRGLANIETTQSPAEQLPLADASFDFLACRYSAHHWRDFDAGLRQARRVLKRGKTAVFIDAYAPGHPLFDTHLQAVELLRDKSHVRDYSVAEWVAALNRADFAIAGFRKMRVRMDFPVWVARMATPEEDVQAMRRLQLAASVETRAHFDIEADGSFMLDVMMIEAVAGI